MGAKRKHMTSVVVRSRKTNFEVGTYWRQSRNVRLREKSAAFVDAEITLITSKFPISSWLRGKLEELKKMNK